MSRVTIKNLNALCEQFNRETNSPMNYWADGKPSGTTRSKVSVGHYTIDQAYGGYALSRTCNESGGESTILIRGTAGDLYERMHAWLAGYRAAKGHAALRKALASLLEECKTSYWVRDEKARSAYDLAVKTLKETE